MYDTLLIESAISFSNRTLSSMVSMSVMRIEVYPFGLAASYIRDAQRLVIRAHVTTDNCKLLADYQTLLFHFEGRIGKGYRFALPSLPGATWKSNSD